MCINYILNFINETIFNIYQVNSLISQRNISKIHKKLHILIGTIRVELLVVATHA